MCGTSDRYWLILYISDVKYDLAQAVLVLKNIYSKQCWNGHSWKIIKQILVEIKESERVKNYGTKLSG